MTVYLNYILPGVRPGRSHDTHQHLIYWRTCLWLSNMPVSKRVGFDSGYIELVAVWLEELIHDGKGVGAAQAHDADAAFPSGCGHCCDGIVHDD